ncbi:hypothetical protein J2R95_003167 [Bradyrhizobium japonicum]|nr:hypothetical protein [Bradyrhizobium japonicum]
MKRLLLGPALALPLFLGLCHLKGGEAPKVPEVVKEIPLPDFEQRFPRSASSAVPPIPTTPPAVLPEPVRKPVVRHKPAEKQHVRPAPTRSPRVVPPEAPPAPEALPPQQGVVCIFPFNLIPTCTPGVP